MPYLPCISRYISLHLRDPWSREPYHISPISPPYLRYISLHLRYPWSREPYYANSDDQTLLNDAIVSAVTGNRTYLGSTMPYP